MKYEWFTTKASNRISHRSSPQSLRPRWNHYGYQFSIFQNLPSFIGVPIWYNSSPSASTAQRSFPLRTPPLPPTETTLGNDSNNGFDMLVQSRDIPRISSNYFLIVPLLLLLFSLYMKKATRQLPGGGFWCRHEVPFCVMLHTKRHVLVILRYDPNDSHCLQSMTADSGVPRNSFRGGGFNKFSWGKRTERTGIWGRSPLVRGSGGSCNLVQEISFHIITFS